MRCALSLFIICVALTLSACGEAGRFIYGDTLDQIELSLDDPTIGIHPSLSVMDDPNNPEYDADAIGTSVIVISSSVLFAQVMNIFLIKYHLADTLSRKLGMSSEGSVNDIATKGSGAVVVPSSLVHPRNVAEDNAIRKWT